MLGAEFGESGYSLFVFVCVADGFGKLCAFGSEIGLVTVAVHEAIHIFYEFWVSPPALVRSGAMFAVATCRASML